MPSVPIWIPRKDGTYRQQCECGAVSESESPFNPDLGFIEAAQRDFMNLHSGMGHPGVTEFWVQGRWIEGGRWSPMTDEDWKTVEQMGGL